MSQYLRGSRTIHYANGVDAKWTFGEEVVCGRITVTVLVVTSQHRRAWKRALERLGLVATEVDSRGHHRESGLPRTISYSVSGLFDSLRELIALDIVEHVEGREAAIPRGGRPQDYVVVSGKSEPTTSAYIPCPHGPRPTLVADKVVDSQVKLYAIAPDATGPWA